MSLFTPGMVCFTSVSTGEKTATLPLPALLVSPLPTAYARNASSSNAAATTPGTINVVMVLLARSKIHSRCSAGLESMGALVAGSMAELETATLLPSAETASTLPTGTGETRLVALLEASSTTSPALVPRNARAPARSNTMELGTPGRLMAVPTAGGVLLISIGISVFAVPGGEANELPAYTVVVLGLDPFTETLNRLL